jgi:hypothetical protein
MPSSAMRALVPLTEIVSQGSRDAVFFLVDDSVGLRRQPSRTE